MTEVKICGITRLEDALVCAEAGVDALGFIFHEKSARYIDPRRAAKMAHHIPPRIVRVGVFVDSPPDQVRHIALEVGLDMFQFHGQESPDYCALFDPNRAIKAVFPGKPETPPWEEYPARALLIDTYSPLLAGGTGKTTDWDFAALAARRLRIILAGGLNPDNIADAITIVRSRAVDINSGVELAPGIKDRQKVLTVMNLIRSLKGKALADASCFFKAT